MDYLKLVLVQNGGYTFHTHTHTHTHSHTHIPKYHKKKTVMFGTTLLAVFAFMFILLLTACRRTSPARSILSKVAFDLSKSRCSFSTTLAYELNTPVISSMSVLHCFNGRSLRLKFMEFYNIFKLIKRESFTNPFFTILHPSVALIFTYC